jgi:hypothetical protein
MTESAPRAPQPHQDTLPAGPTEPTDQPIAGHLAGGAVATVLGAMLLLLSGAFGAAAFPFLLAVGGLVLLGGVWSLWVALSVIGDRSDAAAGHPRPQRRML